MTQNEPNNKFNRLIESEDETHAEPPAQPARPSGAVPRASRPVLDQNNMPLPRRISETDLGGTRVTPAAFETRTDPYKNATPPIPPRGSQPFFDLSMFDRFRSWGCLVRGLIVALFILVIVGLCLGSLVLYES